MTQRSSTAFIVAVVCGVSGDATENSGDGCSGGITDNSGGGDGEIIMLFCVEVVVRLVIVAVTVTAKEEEEEETGSVIRKETKLVRMADAWTRK